MYHLFQRIVSQDEMAPVTDRNAKFMKRSPGRFFTLNANAYDTQLTTNLSRHILLRLLYWSKHERERVLVSYKSKISQISHYSRVIFIFSVYWCSSCILSLNPHYLQAQTSRKWNIRTVRIFCNHQHFRQDWPTGCQDESIFGELSCSEQVMVGVAAFLGGRRTKEEQIVAARRQPTVRSSDDADRFLCLRILTVLDQPSWTLFYPAANAKRTKSNRA